MDNALGKQHAKLVEKWEPALGGIEDSYKQRCIAVLMENQAQHIVAERTKLQEDNTAATTTVGQLGTFQKFAMPIVRRVYPELIADKICGVQPMSGPVSQIFYLGHDRAYGATVETIYSKYQLTYKGNTGDPFTNGSAINVTGAGGVNFSSVLDHGAGEGNTSSTMGGDIAAWPIAETILGFNVSAGEDLAGTSIPEMTLHIEQQPIAARTRKMRALWTIEANQDLKAYHNLDLENELTDLLSKELRLEIDRELIENIRNLAYDPNVNAIGGWHRDSLDFANSNNFGSQGGTDGFTPAAYLYDFLNPPADPSGTSTNVFLVDLSRPDPEGVLNSNFAPQHMGHVYANLLVALNLASQDIYRTTHRGPGTWMLTSPLVGAMLESAAKLEGGIAREDAPSNMTANSIEYKGKFAGKYDLFIDPLYPQDEILMGYKGSSPMDAGFIYAPYIPLQLFPTIPDPETFQPRKGIMTRYATAAVQPASRFYRVLRLVGQSAQYLIKPSSNPNPAATTGPV